MGAARVWEYPTPEPPKRSSTNPSKSIDLGAILWGDMFIFWKALDFLLTTVEVPHSISGLPMTISYTVSAD
jgi:hypothetical protein